MRPGSAHHSEGDDLEKAELTCRILVSRNEFSKRDRLAGHRREILALPSPGRRPRADPLIHSNVGHLGFPPGQRKPS